MTQPTANPAAGEGLLPGVLSVVVPVYNEAATLRQIVARIRAVDLAIELIAVDDGSTDGSRETLRELEAARAIDRVVLHESNRGKGAALKSGFEVARGEWVIIQDADLEYDPAEYSRLLAPVKNGLADVVYGSRFMGADPHRVLFFWHYVANRGLTLISNMFTNLNLTDMETCFKLMRREVLSSIELKERRFGVEPELTAKLAAIRGIRIYEVGISYAGRTYEDGKKIGWRDGVVALWCIVRYNLWR
ncbi:MAG: glycosyltransferase family 2 protein [Planctomycetota bacterium]